MLNVKYNGISKKLNLDKVSKVAVSDMVSGQMFIATKGVFCVGDLCLKTHNDDVMLIARASDKYKRPKEHGSNTFCLTTNEREESEGVPVDAELTFGLADTFEPFVPCSYKPAVKLDAGHNYFDVRTTNSNGQYVPEKRLRSVVKRYFQNHFLFKDFDERVIDKQTLVDLYNYVVLTTSQESVVGIEEREYDKSDTITKDMVRWDLRV